MHAAKENYTANYPWIFFHEKKKNLLRKECEQNESLLGITARPQMTKGSPDPFLSSPLKCSGKVQMAF